MYIYVHIIALDLSLVEGRQARAKDFELGQIIINHKSS
jgi:hypothetical protein